MRGSKLPLQRIGRASRSTVSIARIVSRIVSWRSAVFAFLLLALATLPVAAGESRIADTAACTRPGLVAAASSLRFAIADLKASFRARTGCRLNVSFGSSGNTARQIRQGAPFALFLSANEAYVRALIRDGLTKSVGSVYALGRLALFAPHGSSLAVDADLDGLKQALAKGTIGHFAIANPHHAPYGRAARQALAKAGLWTSIRPHLILGENVAQAARFTLTDNVQGGLVAYALLKAPTYAAAGRHALLPADAHTPIRHTMVLLNPADPAARRFHAFLSSPEARAILTRYGFGLPPPKPPKGRMPPK